MSFIPEVDFDRSIELQEHAINEYLRLNGTHRVSGDLETVVDQAFQGRVQTLFVPIGGHVWGSFDTATRTLDWHPVAAPGDIDLLVLAVTHTLQHGGSVHWMERRRIPSGSIAAAICIEPLPRRRRPRQRRCQRDATEPRRRHD